MGGICGGGAQTQTQTGSSTTNGSGSYNNTTTPNIPDWWMSRYNSLDNGLDATGMTGDQRAAANFLNNNLTNNALSGAYNTASNATGAALAGTSDAYNTIGSGLNYLNANQNIGSNTLGHWFGDQTPSSAGTSSAAGVGSAAAPAVTAGTGAAYMGAYGTPLNDDYVNASLADYDAGAAQGYNALRAGNASAFGNKRTGVAEGEFMADAARGRGTLSSNLRLTGFNTAAGLGQSDANRALAADTTAAGNTLNNNQFNAGLAQANNQFNANLGQANNQYNANLQDSRQKFDIGEADTGDDRRLGIAQNLINGGAAQAGVAAQGAQVGAQGLNNATNYNAANLSNANAVGNFNNMTVGQLMQLLSQGQAGIGKTDAGTSSSTSATNSSGTATASKAGSPLDLLGKIAMIGGSFV